MVEEQRALSDERRRVLEDVEAAPGRVTAGGVRFLAHALVVPARASSDLERYVVLDCATPAPRLVRVQDPFSKLLAAARASFAHTISAASLLEAAERD